MPLYALGARAVETAGEGRCWIAPNAVVLGHVRLRAMASVWFGAVLRGDNELIEVGERSNVQDGCVLHTDEGYPLTIGPDCTIGHLAMLHGCSIGRNSLIGIGATILNGARIGENCLIGAHALVPEGKVIPDHSLVMGTPGRIVRQVSAEEAAGLTESAAHYVENWQRFAAGLKEQA
jgi:carbonic anhydrase/acetyltransferase-like protein (isoleucine patch superfamily)